MKKRIIFRADGNKQIGFGHVYRLLALADMLGSGFDCCFVINRPDNTLLERIAAICKPVVLDIPYVYNMPAETGIPFDLAGVADKNSILVLDGYHFDETYHRRSKETGTTLVLIDDLLSGYSYADLIINHAPGISGTDYITTARVCTGIGYALLRKPFFSALPEKRTITENWYVCMGAADIHNYTPKICSALLHKKNLQHIHVVCTTDIAEQALRKLPGQDRITIHRNPDAEAIVTIMKRCSFAMVAASTVLMEAYARGLICFTGYTEKNQERYYKGFTDHSMAAGIGNLHLLSEEMITDTIDTYPWEQLEVRVTPLHSFDNYNKLFNQLSNDQIQTG